MITFDTLAVSNRLHAAGLTQAHAEAIAHALQDAGSDSHLVTKEYLNERLETLSLQMTVKLGGMMFVGFGSMVALKFWG